MVLLLVGLINLLPKPPAASEVVRPPAVAGSFYPGEAAELRRTVKEFLTGGINPRDPIFAIVVPHAGYPYSGNVAAAAFKLLKGRKFDTIVLLGPSHHMGVLGAAISNATKWDTPIGTIKLDKEFEEELVKASPYFVFNETPHITEHSLEVEVPFLQLVQNGTPIVPIIIGDVNSDAVANVIVDVAIKQKKSILVVGSVDLSHYHSHETAVKLDGTFAKAFETFEPREIEKVLTNRTAEIDAPLVVLTTMKAAKLLGANKAEVLLQKNSGDVTGDKSGVVGYLAGVMYFDPTVSPEGRKRLLTIARESLENAVRTGQLKSFSENSSELLAPSGAFTSMKEFGDLRGSIGYIYPIKPLYQTVAETAVLAAMQDSRFRPVESQELPNINITVSVLSPLQKISDPEIIQIGVHGIYMTKSGRSAIFLPQVPLEFGWDRETYLRELAMKAGLSADAWKNSTLYIFTADYFSE